MRRPLRIVLAVASLLVCGWAAVQWVNSEQLDTGYDLALQSDLAPAQRERAEQSLRAAETLTPDEDPRVFRAGLLVIHGRPAEGLELALETVADEPDNVRAWGIVAQGAQRTGDEDVAARAARRIAALDPLGAAARE